MSLEQVLLQFFYVICETMQFIGDRNPLRAFGLALPASNAVVSLPELRHTPVISHEKGLAHFCVAWVFDRLRIVAFQDAVIIMDEDAGNINAIRAGHAVLAVVARDGLHIVDILGNGLFKQGHLGRLQGFQRADCPQVILQVFHVCHATEHAKHILVGGGIAECPRSDGDFWVNRLQFLSRILRDIRQPTSQEWFHDHSWYPAFL